MYEIVLNTQYFLQTSNLSQDYKSQSSLHALKECGMLKFVNINFASITKDTKILLKCYKKIQTGNYPLLQAVSLILILTFFCPTHVRIVNI